MLSADLCMLSEAVPLFNRAPMESPPPPLSPRTKLWIVLGVLGGLGYAGWFQLIRDEPPRTPLGFALPERLPAVPDAGNGLVYLDEEIEKQSWPEIEGGEGGHNLIIGWRKPWDAERMQPLVDAAPAMREILEKALGYSGWREETGPGTRSFYKSVDLARNLLLAKVRQLAEAGEVQAAMDCLEPVMRLSRRQEQTPISLAHFMIGAAASRASDATLMQVIALPGANDAILVRGFSWLEPPTALREDMIKGLAGDYRRDTEHWFDARKDPKLEFGDLVGMISGKDVPDWLAKSRFKPQAYHNLRLQHLALLDRISKDTGPARLQELRAARDSLEKETKLSSWSLDPNRVGRILAALNHFDFKIAESTLSCDAFRRCCRVVVAAKRWSLAHGGQRVPALADLVPEYLPEVPLDPYDGRPLRWDAASGTAYVSGSDGVDDLPEFPPGEASVLRDGGVATRLP